MAASKQTPPADVKLKAPSQFEYIGKKVARLDAPAKSTGKAQFTLDTKVPGMVTAVMQRSPLFGGKVKSVDSSKAKAIPGVLGVVQISNGVAVVGKNFWAAKQGRDALQIEWDNSAAENRSSHAIRAA